MGFREDVKKRHDALAEAMGSAQAEAKPMKKKKKRTHVNEFSADEIDAMPMSEFMKLRQD